MAETKVTKTMHGSDLKKKLDAATEEFAKIILERFANDKELSAIIRPDKIKIDDTGAVVTEYDYNATLHYEYSCAKLRNLIAATGYAVKFYSERVVSFGGLMPERIVKCVVISVRGLNPIYVDKQEFFSEQRQKEYEKEVEDIEL